MSSVYLKKIKKPSIKNSYCEALNNRHLNKIYYPNFYRYRYTYPPHSVDFSLGNGNDILHRTYLYLNKFINFN